MVRLRREMEGLDPDPQRRPPAWLGDERLRAIIEAPAREALWELLSESGQTILVSGVPAETVMELYDRGWSVTVVEPDPGRIALLQKMVLDRGATRRVSLIQKEVGLVSFEPSSFEVAVLFAVLNRYPQPTNVVRKTARELKMGGRFFATFVAGRPASSGDAGLPGRLRGLAGQVARRVARVERSAYSLDLDPLVEEIGGILKVAEVATTGSLGPAVASAMARLPSSMRGFAARAIRSADELDGRIAGSLTPTTTLAWVSARKDLGFGRVFKPAASR